MVSSSWVTDVVAPKVLILLWWTQCYCSTQRNISYVVRETSTKTLTSYIFDLLKEVKWHVKYSLLTSGLRWSQSKSMSNMTRRKIRSVSRSQKVFRGGTRRRSVFWDNWVSKEIRVLQGLMRRRYSWRHQRS